VRPGARKLPAVSYAPSGFFEHNDFNRKRERLQTKFSELEMKKRTKRWLGAMALALGALGTAGAVLMRKGKSSGSREKEDATESVWARPGMTVTFRAELMPGREPSERTFRIAELLPSGRVTLVGKAGEHAEREFEPIR
jgi:hypothetical protein